MLPSPYINNTRGSFVLPPRVAGRGVVGQDKSVLDKDATKNGLQEGLDTQNEISELRDRNKFLAKQITELKGRKEEQQSTLRTTASWGGDLLREALSTLIGAGAGVIATFFVQRALARRAGAKTDQEAAAIALGLSSNASSDDTKTLQELNKRAKNLYSEFEKVANKDKWSQQDQNTAISLHEALLEVKLAAQKEARATRNQIKQLESKADLDDIEYQELDSLWKRLDFLRTTLENTLQRREEVVAIMDEKGGLRADELITELHQMQVEHKVRTLESILDKIDEAEDEDRPAYEVQSLRLQALQIGTELQRYMEENDLVHDDAEDALAELDERIRITAV